MTSPVTLSDPTRGILNPAEGLKRVELRRHVPAHDLAGLVDWHWIVRDFKAQIGFTPAAYARQCAAAAAP